MTSLVIIMMRFDAISSAFPQGSLHGQCTTLRKALHERSPDMVDIDENIQSGYSTNLKSHEGDDRGELSQFLMQYLVQVERLQNLNNGLSLRRLGTLLDSTGEPHQRRFLHTIF